MVMDLYDRMRGFKSETPNKFTIAMGELIRQVRIDAKLTQSELAEIAYMRQATVSDIEKGKREASASELLYICNAVKKPISYFFPIRFFNLVDESSLSSLEQELLLNARYLSESDLTKIIAQIKAIAGLSEY